MRTVKNPHAKLSTADLLDLLGTAAGQYEKYLSALDSIEHPSPEAQPLPTYSWDTPIGLVLEEGLPHPAALQITHGLHG